MKHYLMRHLPVSSSGLCIGQTDLPLSEKGRASVDSLTRIILGLAPDLLFSSDLQRCSELAQKAAALLGCPVCLDPRWRELNFGTWEGRSWQEIHETDEETFQRWSHNFVSEPAPQGESFTDLRHRVLAALNDLPNHQTSLVITHAGCLRAVACHCKLVEPERMFDWEVPFGAVYLLDLEDQSLIRHAVPLQNSAALVQ